MPLRVVCESGALQLWTKEWCAGCQFVVFDGETHVGIETPERCPDPNWVARMFDARTSVCIFPTLSPSTKLKLNGAILPRTTTQNLLQFGRSQERIQHVSGVCDVDGFRLKTYRMVVQASNTTMFTQAPTWPITLRHGANFLPIPHDSTVAPFFNIRKELCDGETMDVDRHVRRIIEFVREALDAVMTEHETQLGGEFNFRPWCLRVMNGSGPDRQRRGYVISLWFVVANFVMPTLASVRTFFADMVDQHIHHELRGCVDYRCFARMGLPLPWSRGDDGNIIRPIDPDTLLPVCTPNDGDMVMASVLGDYLPIPHLRTRCLISPLFSHDERGTDDYWIANDDFMAVDPSLYGDSNVVQSPEMANTLLKQIATWRFRVPSHVMRLTRNLVAMGVGTEELERYTTLHDCIREAKRMRPTPKDMHDGALVRWAKLDSDRTDVNLSSDNAETSDLGDRLSRPLERTAGVLFFDLLRHIERTEAMESRPANSVIGILQRTVIESEDVQYVRPFSATTRGIRFVKAALGTGKSVANWETVVLWLKAAYNRSIQPGVRHQPLRVIVGTPRRTLAAATVVSANQYLEAHYDAWEDAENRRYNRTPRRPRLRFVHYLDESLQQRQTEASPIGDLCVWQLESFRKLSDVPPFDLVLFDEVASLLRCLTGSMVRKNRFQMEETIREFTRLVNAAKLVVVSDGNLTVRDIRAINDASSRRITAERILHVYRRIPQRGKVVWHFSEKPDPEWLSGQTKERKAEIRASCTALSKWLSSLCRDMAAGKRLYVYSGSKRLLVKTLIPMLQTIEGLDIDREVLLLTAETIDHGSPMDVMRVWSTKRLVAVSPTVTVGLDFSPVQPYFHAVYAYVSAFGAGPRDSVQSMVRVRNTIERKVHVCMRMHIESKAKDSQTQRHICAQNFLVRSSFVKRLTSMRDHVWTKEPTWLEELAVDNAFEDSVASNDLLGCIRVLLKQAGYDSENGEVFTRDQLDDSDVRIYTSKPIERTFDAIEDITTERYVELKNRIGSEGISEEQKLQIARYDFVHHHVVDQNDSETNATIWDWTCGRRRCMNAFKRIVLEKTEANLAVSRIIERDAVHTNMPSFLPSTNLQLHVVVYLYRDVLRIPGSWVSKEFSMREVATWRDRIAAIQEVASRQFSADRTNPMAWTRHDSDVRQVIRWMDRIIGSWSGATIYGHDTGRVCDLRTDHQWSGVVDANNTVVVRHAFVPGIVDIERHVRFD